MRSGRLRHKIEFITVEDGRDEFGGTSEVEVHFSFSKADIVPINGGERFMSNQLYAEATSQIRCRYVSGVTQKHKIKFVDRYFDILDVQNKDERNKELFIIAKEIK